ncbi:hypothetical protein RvY_11036 [Ramazzottius varieornatus]|uniref:Uncharacterized protein n=1 Tax=Ramazzottius varieornatus TaxID=947166 RepID=A0A1D1VK78_RAMVA|nr:hypothetical protein RvY_11036 [Ramazzottius varieornatus]
MSHLIFSIYRFTHLALSALRPHSSTKSRDDGISTRHTSSLVRARRKWAVHNFMEFQSGIFSCPTLLVYQSHFSRFRPTIIARLASLPSYFPSSHVTKQQPS